MSINLDQKRIRAFRLTRHGLRGDAASTPLDAVRLMCGAQAQVQSAAELQIRVRNPRISRAMIGQALWRDRSLVKTSAMRQTLHLLPAQDYQHYICALRKSRTDALVKIMSKFGITSGQLARLNELIIELLKDGPKSAAALFHTILPQASKPIQAYCEKAWSIQLFRLAMIDGLICYGPDDDGKPTFVRTDQWLPRRQPQGSVRQAQRWLVQRYLHNYAPATVADFSRWSGIQVTEARMIWAANSDFLQEVQTGFGKASMLKQDMARIVEGQPVDGSLCLLPHFDPFLLGHCAKTQFVEQPFLDRVYRAGGWIAPVLLCAGEVVGTWSAKRAARKATFSAYPFGEFTAKMRKAFDENAAALADFWGVDCITTVNV